MEATQPNINPSNPTPEQVKIYRSLFSGRDDAYGHEKLDGGFECIHEPLTHKVIEQHLNGEDRTGIYPLGDDGNVRWAVIDIDEVDECKKPNTRKAKENAIKVYATLVESKLAPYLENSKSKGFHLWLFFDEAIPAKVVRKVLKRILKNLGLNYEVFPKQDQIASDNGVGNFVFLPLDGKLIKAGRTLFLDSNFEAIPDQWEYLSKVHRTKIETIFALADKLLRDDIPNETGNEIDSGISVDLDAYLKDHNIEFRKKKQGSRTLYNLRRCAFDSEHSIPDKEWQPAIIQDRRGLITYFCFHAHCANKRWADIRQVISGNESLNQFIEKPNPYTSALLNADYVILLKIPPKNIFINPWFYQQENLLIAGWRGVGKSWFVISLFDAVTREESFGPWDFISSIPCLYIDGEMAFVDIQERLKLLDRKDRKPRKAPLLIYSDAYANSLGLPRANLTSREWRRDVKRLALDNGIKAIGIDNLGSLAPGIDENSKKDWDGINEWLLDLRFSGITTGLLHHTGKGGSQRGTSAHEDNIDCSISLCQPHDYKTEDGARFIVKFKKTRISTKELKLIQDHEFRLTQVEDHVEWACSAAKKKNQIEILRLLDEGMKQEDIAGLIGVTRPYVGKIKAKAIKERHLDSQGKLTKEGQDFVNKESIFDMDEDT